MERVRGTLFLHLIDELIVSANLGTDPEENPRLQASIGLAREAEMPSGTIRKVIEKVCGGLEHIRYEWAVYDGYGPGGGALLVECLTDDRNRTEGELRTQFSKCGGSLTAKGEVGWTCFSLKGSIRVEPGPTQDQIFDTAIDAGADEVIDHGTSGFEVLTRPEALFQTASALEACGMTIAEQILIYAPRNRVEIDGENARRMRALLEMLDRDDDVQSIHTNLELDGDAAA